MLNKAFARAESEIWTLKGNLKKIIDEVEGIRGLENHEAYIVLDNLVEKLEDAERELTYLQKSTKEGTLIEDSSTGKFFIEYNDGSKGYSLSCGNSLELFYDDEWHIGRVEARDSKYYFYGENTPFLYTGMRVRKRID